MNPANEKLNSEESLEQPLSRDESSSGSSNLTTSATTSDYPSFGWSAYAERINGRFAMIGFVALLLIEATSHQSFLGWAGIFK